nr:hypothetical protein [uncultured Desulfobacter sp.]
MDFKAQRLANSNKFDVSLCSDDKKIEIAVDGIFDKLTTMAGLTGQERRLKRHIKVLLLNLLSNWEADPGLYTSYDRGSNHYSSLDKRYNKNEISRKLIDVVDAMVALGWIENHKGHYDRTGKNTSHTSRMKASVPLVGEFRRLGISSSSVKLFKNAECVIMRDRSPKSKKQVNVSYKDTAKTKKMRADLERYNGLIKRTSIKLAC